MLFDVIVAVGDVAVGTAVLFRALLVCVCVLGWCGGCSVWAEQLCVCSVGVRVAVYGRNRDLPFLVVYEDLRGR